MKSKKLAAVLSLLMGVALSPSAKAEDKPGADPFDRTILPLHEPQYPRSAVLDVRKAPPPPARFEVKAPATAPNVLIILIDDMGFGHSSAFGGPIQMSTAERLANDGLRFNQFHSTAVCSPSRVALLTGRNHHTNNMGGITETATAYPGNTGQRPNNIASIGTTLRYNGYATSFFGKNHETAPWEVSPSGPTDRWPTRQGFDKFYGFFGGETNQWAPAIYDGMIRVEHSQDPNYHFMTDMTNQAINWTRSVKSLTPDKPFFIYFAPGATHAPHHVPKEWIKKYHGKFDQGWDKLREETLARQIELGVVPAGTKLAPKPEAIRDWESLSADEKKLFARQMETFAGFGEQTDYEIGRLISAIDDLGELDNTLVFYILGDNGASAEGGESGMFSEMTYFNGVQETVEDMLRHYDDWGGPTTYAHVASGWAVAGDTPFTWTKQVCSNYGGTRQGMVVHYPRGIKAKGEVRSQWHHLIDVVPTILEVASLPEPKLVDGIPQEPIAGVSMAYTFDAPEAKDRRTTQYFEMFGNRAIYHDGWLAGTVHRAAWERVPRRPLEEDIWELYDTRVDFSLANDLAQEHPEKLKEMQALFLKEAEKYGALPIDDRVFERVNAATAGRPDLMAGRKSLTLYEGMTSMSENVFINIKNRSLTITAQVTVPDGANGVILAQAGRFGGWTLYLRDGKPCYTYNFLGLESYDIVSKDAIAAGDATVRFEFDYEGGMGKGGLGTILVDGKKVAEGRIDRTQAIIFSADEGADVGQDGETPVTENYGIPAPYRFTGNIHKVVVDIEDMQLATSGQ